MTDSRPLVWLPFDPARLGTPPEALRYEVFDPGSQRGDPSWLDEVEVYVPTYAFRVDHAHFISRMPRLRLVQTLTAGVEHLRAAVPEGVVLCNGRGIHNASTAELAVALTLAVLRDIPGFAAAQHEHRWTQGFRESLADKTVLIVGYGDIGADVEKRLLPFEVEVLRVARTARDGVHDPADLPELLPRADAIILVVPGTSQTRGMVDAGFLKQMKHNAVLVNVSRGAVVVTDDLIAAAEAGSVRAALDVTDPEPLPADHPLWSTPGVLVTPHVGGATPAMWPRAYRLVRDQLQKYAAGEEPANIMRGEY
ncbi:MAG: 2-hydroxyacid dehydrogenase [Nocardioidaceae bacterium]